MYFHCFLFHSRDNSNIKDSRLYLYFFLCEFIIIKLLKSNYKQMKLKNNKIIFLNITYIIYNYYIKNKNKILKYLLLSIFLFGNFNKFLEKRFYKISVVVPIISRDFNKIYNNIRFYIKFIDEIKNIIFIGNEEINKLIKEKKSSLSFPLIFINEKKLINVNKIKQLIK